ncbi:hypothetical protein SAMN05428945_5890 [Streptomyces sp. 2224.1]|nr:hypothetical protein SAMN05428945_5890 [Streptomyces sp. 2224.1]
MVRPKGGVYSPRLATRVPVTLELTDIAPAPVRDRVRARVTVTGLPAAPYSAEATKSTCMEFGQAVLEDSRERASVSLHALLATARRFSHPGHLLT